MVVSVPKDYRSKPGEYGETKKQKQFLLTPTASDILDSLASEYKTTRSDLIEKLVRGLDNWDKFGRDRLMVQIGVIEDEEEYE